MKYWLEILLIGTFTLIIVLIYNKGTKQQESGSYAARIDSLGTIITGLKYKVDSIQLIEVFHEKKITLIKKYYDSSKVYILIMDDSLQFDLLRSNIAGHRYLINK